ncbi:uncharacterized protein [Diabrotica undecimpunctata]|uniref:uncharacterized protein n=1 Tax=Diabrotica undecimpunctata TaxID=50387 RepID=UPI003B63DAF2
MVFVIMAANNKLFTSLCEQNKRNLQEICDTNGSSECDDSDKDPDYSFNEDIGKKKKHRKIWPTPLSNHNLIAVSDEPDKTLFEEERGNEDVILISNNKTNGTVVNHILVKEERKTLYHKNRWEKIVCAKENVLR